MAYVTVTELQQYAKISSDADNSLLQSMIDDAVAELEDGTGFSFEATADTTLYLDADEAVDGRTLILPTWCAAITTVTNGDGTVITSDYYVTEPRNAAPYYAIKLLASSGYTWATDDNGDPENAISIAGRWAYSTSPPTDIKHAIRRLALWYYRQRDNSTDMDRPLLAEGVTILPSQKPKDVTEAIDRYRWRGAS